MLALFKAAPLFGLLLVNVAFAQPTNIQLEYDVSRNDSSFGTVKDSYEQEGDQYHIISTTEGKGLYALLGKRVLMSDGQVTVKGLVPAKFQLKRDSKEKSFSAMFDWASNQLNMLVKGESRTATLVAGTLDLASYPYQFMFAPPAGKQVSMTLTAGKKLDKYVYNIVDNHAVLDVGGVSYETIHLVSTEVEGKKKKELWLAKSKHYIPVKYLVVDKHGDKIEQTLTNMRIK